MHPSPMEAAGLPPRVLVVDDEKAIRTLLNASLAAHGYAVSQAENGEQSIQQVRTVRPDVIVLDLGLPDVDGTDIIRCVREWANTPIIVLSVRDEETQKIAALDAGADDYLTKPFSPGELLARIRASLRRASTVKDSPTFLCGEMHVDLMRREVRLSGQPVQLTPTEYDLLTTLIHHAGKVLTHRQLIHEVWGGAYYHDAPHLLRVTVSNLRHKLEREATRPRLIVTEPGVGYRLRSEI